MSHTIPAQAGTSFYLRKGQYLKVMDPFGKQVADLFCALKSDLQETLSSGRSIDYNDSIFLSIGHILYSHSGKTMLEIIEDSCGRHDFLVTPCSLQMFQMMGGNKDYHPSCLENLANAMQEFSFDVSRISTTFNIFMNYEIDSDGKLNLQSPTSKPGDYILFEAKTDLLIGLTACSDESTNAGSCKPIQYEIHDS